MHEDHTETPAQAADRFFDAVHQEILAHLDRWHRRLMGAGPLDLDEDYFADEHNQAILRELAANIIGMLTYVTHGQHPWYDELIVERTAGGTDPQPIVGMLTVVPGQTTYRDILTWVQQQRETGSR
jgi:hypothetical protein